MKVEQTAEIGYDEVAVDFCLKLPCLFRRLQHAAIYHSESVGLGPESMARNGGVWILHRMRVNIHRMPMYRETITVRTWHKGSTGFRAGRDYLVLCGEETVAAATSQWLYYDLSRKRIAKIAEAITTPYGAEKEDALDIDRDINTIDFPIQKGMVPSQTLPITTRHGDYDTNGHVNNTVYLEYLDTFLCRTDIVSGRINRIGIEFIKEIGFNVHTIHCGASRTDDAVYFRLYDPSAIYAAGFITMEK